VEDDEPVAGCDGGGTTIAVNISASSPLRPPKPDITDPHQLWGAKPPDKE